MRVLRDGIFWILIELFRRSLIKNIVCRYKGHEDIEGFNSKGECIACERCCSVRQK